MKRIFLSFLLSGAAAFAASADSFVTNLVVRQRTPWQTTVDVDYAYAGDVATNMTYSATWDGQSEPVSLLRLDSAGVSVSPGDQVVFSWDPAAAGYGAADLKNFRVTVTPVANDPRTYLVVDLVNGGYTTMAEPPAGGWTDDYKTTKLVFRRIPAGTYALGTTESDFRNQFGDNYFVANTGRGAAIRTITYTTDFYFQVFFLTFGQLARILNASDTSTEMKPSTGYKFSYADYRGATLDDGTTAVNWPVTGHQVASSSLVGKLRARMAATGQDALIADLPTDAQWQLAMSAGENTFYPNGGVPGDSAETITNLVRTGFWTKALDGKDPNSYVVGLKPANRWGIYDFNIRPNPCLDWLNDNGTYVNNNGSTPYLVALEGGTNPVGPASSPLGLRLLRGGVANGASYAPRLWTLFDRNGIDPSATEVYNAPRFVINLKPIVDVK